MAQPHLTIYFTNGSEDQRQFTSVFAARLYARDHISYTGGKVRRVTVTDEYGSEMALWDACWDGVSQYAGLWNGLA